MWNMGNFSWEKKKKNKKSWTIPLHFCETSIPGRNLYFF